MDGHWNPALALDSVRGMLSFVLLVNIGGIYNR